MHIEDAKTEAQRFHERLRRYELQVKTDGHKQHYGCPERAALLRSSMDLSKALARMRTRPGG